ncbi:MAG: [Fe-Fe] hydrogenase large subunit C-terminal domain-containing protein [Armatimonadota bacterium]
MPLPIRKSGAASRCLPGLQANNGSPPRSSPSPAVFPPDAALRCMGAEKVYDTSFAADLTIMEEAAVRTAYFKLTGEELPRATWESVPADRGVRETTLKIDGHPIKLAMVSGLANAMELIEKVRSGSAIITWSR